MRRKKVLHGAVPQSVKRRFEKRTETVAFCLLIVRPLGIVSVGRFAEFNPIKVTVVDVVETGSTRLRTLAEYEPEVQMRNRIRGELFYQG